MMRQEFALGVGESFVVAHPCGMKHTVINIEGIEADAGEVEMLLQTWNQNTLLQSKRIILAATNLSSLANILSETDAAEESEMLAESSSLSGYDWSR